METLVNQQVDGKETNISIDPHAGTQESRSTIKVAVEEAEISLLRAYIRFFPANVGKAHLWTNCFDGFLRWKTGLKPRVVKTRFGFSLQVALPDIISTVVLLTGRWEPFITKFVLDTLCAGDTFIDVGANIGYYSLLASSVVSCKGCVYSIEGSPLIFRQLEENIARNRAINITAINAIVSDCVGQKPFWLASEANLGHSTSIPFLAANEGMRFEANVACTLLDKLLTVENLFKARLIKIDVEGAERQVVSPIVPMLRRFSKRTAWIIELSPQFLPGGQEDADWIYHSFCNAGYRAFAIHNEYSIDDYLARVSSPGFGGYQNRRQRHYRM